VVTGRPEGFLLLCHFGEVALMGGKREVSRDSTPRAMLRTGFDLETLWEASERNLAKFPEKEPAEPLSPNFMNAFQQCGSVSLSAAAAAIHRDSHHKWLAKNKYHAEAFPAAKDVLYDRFVCRLLKPALSSKTTQGSATPRKLPEPRRRDEIWLGSQRSHSEELSPEQRARQKEELEAGVDRVWAAMQKEQNALAEGTVPFQRGWSPSSSSN